MLPDRDYPADPYPGAVPDCSFVHLDQHSHRIHPDRTAAAGWSVGPRSGPGPRSGADLDDWLADHGGPPLAARIPLLTYGSNRCPSKITWLRRNLGLAGPVVVLRATTRDVAAVWAAGLRKRDGQRPAVLAAAPGAVEEHAVWLATTSQIEVLDRCEGRDDRYRLARPRTTVRTEDGGLIEQPWCYLGLGAIRRPLLVEDAAGVSAVRCADLPQRRARHLRGRPATDDELGAETVHGSPHPDQWPAALFAHGPLQPGRPGWPLVEPHHHGTPRPARASGPGMPGTLVPLRDPGTALPALDDHAGPGYRRLRLRLDDGAMAWAYVRRGDRSTLRPRWAGPGC